MISRPCFLNSLKDSLEISLSAIGRKSSNASITVTLDPSRDHTLPSSKPIIPAPTTPRVSGTLVKPNAPVLSTMFLPKGAEGISMGLDPVAIIIFLVSIFSTAPSAFTTSTVFASIIFPLPEYDSTLLEENNPLIPPVSLLTISSFLFIIVLRSSFSSPISMPCSLRFLLAS